MEMLRRVWLTCYSSPQAGDQCLNEGDVQRQLLAGGKEGRERERETERGSALKDREKEGETESKHSMSHCRAVIL